MTRRTVTTAAAALALGAALAAVPRQTWIPQTTGVTATLRGVSAVDDRIAWASGSRGTILRTTDAGATWQPRGVPDALALDFRDVDAVDASTAYVLSIGNGAASRIYKTTDAGLTWVKQFQNEEPDAFFDAMAFWDAQRGIAVSDSVRGQFVVLRTLDGGATWTRLPPDRFPPALPNEGYFAASGTNVAVHGTSHVWLGTGAAERARVLRSTDAGDTWRVADTPLVAGPTMGIYSIAFRDPVHGLVVGGDYAREGEAVDNIARTRDGGATWTLVRRTDGTSAVSGFRSVVAYLPGTTSVLAVGPSGSDISTDDGGTWASIEGPGFHTFSFAPGLRTGWGGGGRGRVARLQW